MKFVLQRVKEAQVTISGRRVGRIDRGLLIFIGVEKGDREEETDHFVRKIAELRLFEDENGKMNLSALETKAEMLVVSQFTLVANCEKGRRPSFDNAADPQTAEMIYNSFVNKLKNTGLKVETGEFRAMMDVALINDGPVTFIL